MPGALAASPGTPDTPLFRPVLAFPRPLRPGSERPPARYRNALLAVAEVYGLCITHRLVRAHTEPGTENPQARRKPKRRHPQQISVVRLEQVTSVVVELSLLCKLLLRCIRTPNILEVDAEGEEENELSPTRLPSPAGRSGGGGGSGTVAAAAGFVDRGAAAPLGLPVLGSSSRCLYFLCHVFLAAEVRRTT